MQTRAHAMRYVGRDMRRNVSPATAGRYNLERLGTIVRRFAALAMMGVTGAVDAQSADARGSHYAEFVAGSSAEAYLRAMHLGLKLPDQQWSLRRAGPLEAGQLLRAANDSAHPWRRRGPYAERTGRLYVVAPTLTLVYNSALPYGVMDGAVWAGRGLTTSLAAGVTVRYGPLTVTLQPTLFYAENRAFTLRGSELDTSDAIYRDWQYGASIDLPQRFGDGAITRLDGGQSEARLDAAGAAVGFSTANEQWGPAFRYPYILGANAGGFPHLFAGTARSIPIGIGRISTRALWGRLGQSAYSAAPPINAKRFGAALAIVFQPRGLNGLELGGARFFHMRWPRSGITRRQVLKPFEGLLKIDLPAAPDDDPGSADSTNQLASVFARLRLPESRFELYGEFGREDHAYDLRTLFLEPEYLASRMLGFQRVWVRSSSTWWVARAERISHRASNITRRAGGTYLHGRLEQGHTHNGQLLGADAGLASGAGSVVAFDRYDASGRWSTEWSRVVRHETGDWWSSGIIRERAVVVLHSLAVERLLFRDRWDVAIGATGGLELNHNLERDLFNMNVRVAIRPSIRTKASPMPPRGR